MNLQELKVLPFRLYGDLTFRGKCPKEEVEQITFFNRLRREYPNTYGLLAIHPANEGQRKGAGFAHLTKQKALGLTPGASDIVLPGSPALVIELKRRDYTLCQWQDGQIEYLTAAHNLGAFACVAFGVDAAWEAFNDWRKLVEA